MLFMPNIAMFQYNDGFRIFPPPIPSLDAEMLGNEKLLPNLCAGFSVLYGGI